MSNSTAQVLMKKGKRGAAAYIHADCENGSPQHLGPLLDVLLNPSKAIDEWETIDWCRWLLAGGRTPDEFATIVRSYDKHDKCGLVWIPRVVAYRCRTCGISPCMSICRECFHRGDHSTHDFNMFLSQAGGACDCGDKSVMKEDGFCSNHGNKCTRPGDVPAALMCVAEAMMPRLILRLLQHFRENSCGSQTTSDSYRITVQECEGYVKMLMEFNNMGDLMRSAMTKALINPQMYRNLVEPPFPDTEYGCYMAESNKMYEKALEMFPAPEPPDEYRHLPALAPRLQHNTLLDEFIFWTFKYEFPQNVVCFLLNMLPDQDYKEHLTRTFVLHYARIPLVLEEAADPDTLSNRVVHMSVQLFSNEALALRCVQQLHLLHVMVLSLRLMMGKILVQNSLHDPEHNFHYVIDCTRRVMKEHCYWPLVSDFNNVLSHKSVALLFLQDDALVDMWFEFLSMLQGMNVNVREVGGHIEFEPSSYYAAFSCELEAAAYPMWSVLSHLTEPAHAPLARRMLAAALTYLQDWLDAVHFTTPHMERTEVMQASFHFPLHRYLAAFLCAGVRCMGLRAADVLPPPDLLALLAVHPLRVQSLFYEILAGVWVRNGLQIKGQAMTYIQANFCNSMVDMDIYWLQVCAAHLPADQFLDMCIDMFGCREWLSMMPMSPAQAAEQDAMVEGLLTFLAILVSSRTNLGNDELTQSRLEVSTLLAAGDKTHSQLLELMPERSGNAHTRNFETVLKELSTYRPPPKGSENLEQGLFVPKPIVWEQYYDPLHVLRRAVHRRDFHASMERFTTYVREKQKSEGTPESTSRASGVLWPPLRGAGPPAGGAGGAGDPRALCASGVLHGALLAVLHRGVHRRAPDAAAPHAPPDHVLALATYLLGVAADLLAERAQQCLGDVAVAEPARAAVSGVPLLGAFAGGAVCDNARTVVGSVPARPPRAPRHAFPAHYTPHHHSDSTRPLPCPRPAPPDRALQLARAAGDTEWEPSETETTRIPLLTTSTSLPATSTALAVPTSLQVARGDSMTDDQSDGGGDAPQIRALEDVSDDSQALALQTFDEEMSLAIATSSDLDTPPVPIEYGDGPYFIGGVLRKLAALDARCGAAIAHVRHSLWPHQRERQAEQRARERREKEERSRRARERQAQVMRDFQRRQQQFMSSMHGLDEPGAMDWDEDALPKDYDCESWLVSVCVGWEGGVHVQSCGHHLHLRCLHAYLRALQAPQRPHNLHVERGEFLCPVCRQLANCVLPLAPRPARPAPRPPRPAAARLQDLLDQDHPPPAPSRLSEAMGKAMEDMTATAGGKLKQRYGSSPAAIFTFVASLVRTNLECELVQRGGTLQTCVAPRYKLRNECIVPLLVVAGAHSRVLASAGAGFGAAEAWRLLAPGDEAAGAAGAAVLSGAPSARPVPLLLRDPLALLMHFLLLAPPTPPYLDMEEFTCIVRVLYSLSYYQVVCQLIAGYSAEGRAALLGGPRGAEPAGLRPAARLLLAALAGSDLFTEDGPPAPGPHELPDLHAMEKQVQDLLLPFLRISALLRHHLYGSELPEVSTPRQEFVRLAYYLELVTEGMEWSEWSAGRALCPDSATAARAWARQLGAAASRGQLAVRRLLRSMAVEWVQPGLLALPRDYDRLFTYYHERVCLQCGAVPKEASVCLLCGTLVCLKQPCCRQHQVAEAVQHAMECGGGTGIFLVVTSTYIIVIRGRRACLWGSLYLDDYDEEDRDLKRGKPLYLSQDRLELLQAQWLAHRFDHTKRTWVWHRDSL
ncbi:unnamed protein product [Spodoptera littoralis]|uniref:E3 ubiquitin-protein ligase n=1 Tax=Spodoptera littoralis TaxID=7109 RepID=A0A9P0I0N8_SPOLI|nr:unnamed protein product [Spodoptera littoralis]CAH1638018.1 unnamed protein product [Spodoptera littoralis]